MKLLKKQLYSDNSSYNIIFLTIIIFLVFFREHLFNYYIVYSDISAHYFINKINHQQLFPRDIFTNNLLYFFDQKLSPGNIFLSFFFNWYYFATIYLSRIIPLIYLLKIYTFIQVFSCSYLLLKIKKKYNLLIDKFYILLSFFFIFFSMDTFLGGMPRGFAIVIILYYFSIIIDNNFKKYIFVILFSAFIYPQLLPFLFINTSLTLIRNKDKHSIIKISFLLFYALIILLYIKNSASYLSAPFTSESARMGYSSYKSAVFIKTDNYILKVWDIFRNYFLNNDDHPIGYSIVVYIYILINFLKVIPLRIPPSKSFINHYLHLSLLSSLISFTIISSPALFSKEPLFFLHLAGKPFKYLIPLYLSIQVSSLFSHFLQSKFSKSISFFLFFIFQLLLFKPNYINYKNYSNVFDEIKKLPEKVMIAGSWKNTEFIPLFTDKQVYSMHIWQELAGNNEFTKEHMRRFIFLKDLYLDRDLKSIIKKLQTEKISHIIINENPEVIQFDENMFLSNKIISYIRMILKETEKINKYSYANKQIIFISVSDLDAILSSLTK